MKKSNIRRASLAALIILVFAMVLEWQIAWLMTRTNAERSTTILLNQVEQILDNNAQNAETHTQELKETYISYAQIIGYIVDARPEIIDDQAELERIAERQGVDEIHIFDETGTIIAGTVPKYYGYSFDSGEQMGYFKPMLEDRTLSMCQDVTPNTAEGKSMMYAIAWDTDGTYMIQIGIEPKRLLAELEQNDISNVISRIPLTAGFDIYAVDTATGELTAGSNEANVEAVSLSEFAGKLSSGESSAGSGVIRHQGDSYYCNYRLMDSYVIAVVYSMNTSIHSMLPSLILLAVYLLLAGVVILLLFTRLYRSNAEIEVQRKQLEESVERMEEDEEIIRAAGYGIWICPVDASGHVSGMTGNEEWKSIFGIDSRTTAPGEILQCFRTGLMDQDADLCKYDFSDMDPSVIMRMTFPWKHPEKGIIYVEIAGAKHVSANGELQVSGYAADVTRETEAKQAWERELMEEREKANAANRAKTSFLFNMSHDIRTPMNAIIGFTDLIEKHYDDREKCMDYLHKTQEANQFLLSLINDVLEMARIESGKTQLNESVCRLGGIAEEMASIFEEQMQKKQLTFTSTIEVHTPAVLADQPKLREIYLNILSNALKYTPEGGSVSAETKELPAEHPGETLLRLTVSDTGIGMSEEFLPHLFEEFTRERTATESRQQGTGLGMPIVKKLIELMGGTIAVESAPGKGSTFTVSLPLKLADVTEAEWTAAPAEQAAGRSYAGIRLLLAEDNDLNAEIAAEILTDAGFLVDRAEDGQACVDALQNAEAGTYALILMDIQMPHMNGYQAARAIRALEDPEKNQIPIIAMTANAFDSDRQDALQAGMNGHLAKPIEISKLMETLAAILK